jgi:hypothetical protein
LWVFSNITARDMLFLATADAEGRPQCSYKGAVMIDIIAKIRNLRKLSTSSNPHEAATAAALADQLIQKHRIEETELEIGAGVAAELGEDPTPIQHWLGRKKKWEALLAHQLCEHYDVASYNRRTESSVSAMAVGHPSDIRLVREMYAYLHSEITALAGRVRGHGKSVHAAFRLGCVAGAITAMRASKERGRGEMSEQVAIVLASRYDESTARLMELHPDLVQTKHIVPSDEEAFQAGFAAGTAIEQQPTKRLKT